MISGEKMWTLDDIRYRLTEAAETLRCLPMPKGGRPGTHKVAWPDMPFEWLTYASPTRAPRIPPPPERIERMEVTLGWLHWLADDQRKIVWARACGWSWRKIEAFDATINLGHGRQERQLRNICRDGEARIMARLRGLPGRALTPHDLVVVR